MTSWRNFKFGDHVHLTSGGTPSKSNEAYWNGDIPWVSCKDMKTNRLYDSQDHVTREGVKNGTRLIGPGTILIVVRGMILADEFPVAMAMRDLTFNQDLKAIECSSEVDAPFLFYWLQGNTHEILGIADEAAHGTKRLQTDRLLNLPLYLPPLPIQRKIATILSAYDDLIENNARRIAVLEEMARLLYREWFVEFRFPGHERVRMVDGVPEGWDVVRASDAIYINPSTKVPKDGEKPFLPMNALSNNSMLIGAFEMRSGNSGSKFKNGDTLFARITPCLENGKTGYVQFLPSDAAVAFGSTEFIVLRSKTLCPEYVYLLARSDEFRDNAIKSMSGATGRQRVQEECFDTFLLVQPDSQTLAAFSGRVSLLFREIHVLEQKNTNLRRTRDLLLPRLISGELDVENLEIAGEGEL